MKPRVLHIINTSGIGGAETVVGDIISYGDYPVFCLKEDGIERFREVSDKVYFGTKSKFYKYNPLVLYRLFKIVKKENIQILHTHLANSLLYAILVKKMRPYIRIIYHEHGEIFYNGKLKYLLRNQKHVIDSYVAVSNATKKELEQKASVELNKIRVVYNYVDPRRFKRKKIKIDIKNEKKNMGITVDKFVIGFVGRLNKVKGCEYLIKSLPYLKFKYKVLIVGDGPERKSLENLVKKLKVDEKVIFLGYMQRIEDVYPLMDVLVIPSLNESFGLSLIEALMSRVPVIASNIGGLVELSKQQRGVILFRKGDIKDLSNKLKVVSSDHLSYKNSLKSNTLAKNNSSKAYIEKIRAIYDETV